MRLTFPLAVATTVATLHLPLQAQTQRDLDSHEHGSATLNVAIDGNSVFLELETPWNNLVGFEHTPTTEEQHTLVDDALALINSPSELFGFVGTPCSIQETAVENSMDSSDEHGHDDEHEDEHGDEHGHDDKHEDEHGHGDEHDHDDKHEDEHGHGDEDGHDDKHEDEHAHGDEHDHDEDTHSALLVNYTFACDSASALTAIDVNILSVWSGFEELDVQLIGPAGQSLVEITADQNRIDVSDVQ